MRSAPSRSANAARRDREGARRLRNQWPILAAGALSTISGVGFAAVAVADDTVHLGMLALYAATGAVFCHPGGAARPPFPPAVESAASVPPEQKCRLRSRPGDALAHLSRSVRCLG